MNKKIIYILIIFTYFGCKKDEVINSDTVNIITTQSLSFIPDLVTCNLGDTVFFVLTPTHNAVQVSESVYLNNGGTPLLGGFNIDYGQSGYFVPEISGTYYYVCQPHLPTMKGRIIVQ